MDVTITYRAKTFFTLGDLRRIVDDTQDLLADTEILLQGTWGGEEATNDDVIAIERREVS